MGKVWYFHTLSESPQGALILHLSMYRIGCLQICLTDLNAGQLMAYCVDTRAYVHMQLIVNSTLCTTT